MPVRRRHLVSALAERYELGAEIGRGGMGVVHRAVERATGRTVAVKRLSAAHAGDAALRARFARETRAMARVRHPNVVGIRDTGEDAAGPWLAMDLCADGSLADRLRDGPLPAPEARAVARDVLAALSAIHAAGIIHRDLKPQNILRDDGRWRVSDFGIARDMTGVTAMTQAGMIIGTPDYLAPEHAGDGTVGPEADLYSLGAVLHHALTGTPPYRADSALRLAVLHATAPPPLLPDPVRIADPALAGVVEGLLRKDPAARPTVAEALRRLAGHDETPTLTAAPAAAVTRGRRRPRVRHAVAAILGAAALAVGVAWIADDDPRDTPRSTAPTTAPAGASPAPVRTVTVPAAVAPAAPPPPPAAPPGGDERKGEDDDDQAEDAADGPRGERPAGNGRGKAKGRNDNPGRGRGNGRR